MSRPEVTPPRSGRGAAGTGRTALGLLVAVAVALSTFTVGDHSSVAAPPAPGGTEVLPEPADTRDGVLDVATTAGAGGPSDASALLERHKTTPTEWHWYTGGNVTTQYLTDEIVERKLRLIDIEVRTVSPLTYTAVMVKNQGVHAKTWWWYVGVSAPFIADKMQEHGARILDLENYRVGGQRRYAVILIKRTGADSKPTPWWLNQNPGAIKKKINNQKLRIIDIDRKPNGRYDVVFVKNTGTDKSAWWYWYKVTPSFINSQVKAKKARLVDIEADGSGRFTVVMMPAKKKYWWWYHTRTASQVTAHANQNGARVIDVERYITPTGKIRYAAVMLNNVNAATTRCREIMKPAAKKAAFGCYLKRVGGPVHAGLQHHHIFEPASMIKALYHLVAMRAIQAGNATTTELIQWWRHPDAPNNGGVCAYTDAGAPITTMGATSPMSAVLSGMMQNSDNRHTDAIWNRFSGLFGGRIVLNSMANFVGMTRTEMNHRVGCTWNAPGVVPASNELTLRDAGLLYEKVANGTLLDRVHRALFYQYMNSRTPWWNAVKNLIHAEGSALGVSKAKRDQFIAAVRGAWKPGGYLNYLSPCSATSCVNLSRSTVGGWVEIPFRVSGSPAPRGYVHGNFVDGPFTCPGPHTNEDPTCKPQFDAVGKARREAFLTTLRPQIVAALKTW